MFHRAAAGCRQLRLLRKTIGLEARTAVVHPQSGTSFTYGQLLQDSQSFAQQLLSGRADLAEQRVAFLCPPSYDYAVTMLAIWRAGGVAVPLCVSHPPAELSYAIKVRSPAPAS
jgi:malonyl-CoA/methylmalonyl-CoA synthetase